MNQLTLEQALNLHLKQQEEAFAGLHIEDPEAHCFLLQTEAFKAGAEWMKGVNGKEI